MRSHMSHVPAHDTRWSSYPRSPHRDHHGLLRALAARYNLVTRQILVGPSTYALHAVKDTNRLVDALDPAAFAVDERFPYWAELWPSAVELARWVSAEMSVRGKRVLELGCGLGLAGIAAARAGAEVTMSDYEDDALLFAEANAAANLSVEECARVILRRLDWREPPAGERFECVIGSDVVYERRNFAPILGLLRTVLAPDGYALLTEPDRRVGAEFFAAAVAENFTVALEKVERMVDDGTITVTRARLAVRRGNAS